MDSTVTTVPVYVCLGGGWVGQNWKWGNCHVVTAGPNYWVEPLFFQMEELFFPFKFLLELFVTRNKRPKVELSVGPAVWIE